MKIDKLFFGALLILGSYAFAQASDNLEVVKIFTEACTTKSSMQFTNCNSLAFLYKEGDGVRQNYSEALKLYTKSCDGGDSGGCLGVGNMYAFGEGVKKNHAKAKKFFGKACDLHNDVGGYAGDLGCRNYKSLNSQGVK